MYDGNYDKAVDYLQRSILAAPYAWFWITFAELN